MLEMDNNKEFKILRLNKQEILKIGGYGICDSCNRRLSMMDIWFVFYIAVIVKNATKNGIKLQLTIKKIEKLKKMFMKILNRK